MPRVLRNTADQCTSPPMESMKPGSATPTPASRARTLAPASSMKASMRRVISFTNAAGVMGASSGHFTVLRTPPAKSASETVH